MNWKPISTCPIDTPVIVRNHEEACVVVKTINKLYKPGSTHWSVQGVDSVDGSWEIAFEPTHWTELTPFSQESPQG